VKRTPDPWRARLVHSQMDDPGTTVAVAGPKLPDGRQWMLFADADRGDPEADARLMAAAPKLLEALEAVAPPSDAVLDAWWCPTCKRTVDRQEVTWEMRHEDCGTYLLSVSNPAWVQKARAAIAAARGEL
jgi:hypothetical protein